MGANGNDIVRWKCQKGHTLGLVQRATVTVSGRSGHVSRLMLFRHALDMDAYLLEAVDVVAVIEGTAVEIRCDAPGCGQVRPWIIGADAMERLIEQVKGK